MWKVKLKSKEWPWNSEFAIFSSLVDDLVRGRGKKVKIHFLSKLYFEWQIENQILKSPLIPIFSNPSIIRKIFLLITFSCLHTFTLKAVIKIQKMCPILVGSVYNFDHPGHELSCFRASKIGHIFWKVSTFVLNFSIACYPTLST